MSSDCMESPWDLLIQSVVNLKLSFELEDVVE